MVNLDIPTPPIVPSPSDSPYSLSERSQVNPHSISVKLHTDGHTVNIATRPVHSQLNRLIIARLPLALPPYTTNPSTYISGILHIAPIYITFEVLWNSLINAPPLPISLIQTLDACDPTFQIIDSQSRPVIPGDGIQKPVHTPKVCSRTNALLTHLRLPGLFRAGRLRADIRVLTGTPEHKIDKQLEVVSQNGRLAEFIAHTMQSVEANPHVLLAYAWVFYMALFSGGRYLRASLKEAGGSHEFWDRDPSPVRPYSVTRDGAHERRTSRSESTVVLTERSSRSKTRPEAMPSNMVPGLQFFNFIGDEDGEDIKLEFKKRITEAEILLTDGEKQHIILEAQHIFDFMVKMVGELDAVIGTTEEDFETARMIQSSSVMATRDSVLVTKERLLKSRSVSQEMAQKSSHLQVMFSGPVARVVRFNEGFQDAVMKPLVKNFLDKFSPRPDYQVDGAQAEVLDILLRALVTLLPLMALVVVFVAWYCMA